MRGKGANMQGCYNASELEINLNLYIYICLYMYVCTELVIFKPHGNDKTKNPK